MDARRGGWQVSYVGIEKCRGDDGSLGDTGVYGLFWRGVVFECGVGFSASEVV